MNLPNINDARKRTKDKVNVYYDKYKVDDKLKNLGKEKKYTILTYGCQMNVHDSENMSGIMEELGFIKEDNFEKADVIILNTCAIRENAHNKVTGILGRIKKLREERPNIITVFAGCMAQEEGIANMLKSKYKWVDIVMGTHNLYSLPHLLEEAYKDKKQNIEVYSIEGDIIECLPVKRDSKYKAWINIMYGCDKFCTSLGGADTLATSYTLAQAVKKVGEYDIILGGRQAIDGDTAQVGPQIAEKLGLTQVTYAEEILSLDEKAKKVVIRRHIDGGVETVEAPLPLVVTVNGSAAPCRPRNAKRIMKFKNATAVAERAPEAAEKYEALIAKKPYLDIPQWGAADIDADPAQIGKAGSPTNVKAVKNIVFKAKESRTLSASDADIEGLIKELLDGKIIG